MENVDDEQAVVLYSRFKVLPLFDENVSSKGIRNE